MGKPCRKREFYPVIFKGQPVSCKAGEFGALGHQRVIASLSPLPAEINFTVRYV